MEKSIEQPKRGGRISFAGFVRWRRPSGTDGGAKQQFLSVAGEIEQALQQQHPAESRRKWRVLRLASRGRYFFGFVR
ncbi:MAG: hypothetical protein ABSD20_15535 [Terriglobales bacterium]